MLFAVRSVCTSYLRCQCHLTKGILGQRAPEGWLTVAGRRLDLQVHGLVHPRLGHRYWLFGMLYLLFICVHHWRRYHVTGGPRAATCGTGAWRAPLRSELVEGHRTAGYE